MTFFRSSRSRCTAQNVAPLPTSARGTIRTWRCKAEHHILRTLALSTLLLSGPPSRATNYLIVLENGDTLASERNTKNGPELKLSDRRIPISETVFVEEQRGQERLRWTYSSKDFKKMPLPFCRDAIAAFACAYAAKYGAEKTLGDFPLVDPSWSSDPRFIACYRTGLLDQWIRTDVQGRPLPPDTTGPSKSEDLSIILKNGDVVPIGKGAFYMKQDTLCWTGGGRLHKDKVLLLRSSKGLQIIPRWRQHIEKFQPPIPDLSPASRGVIYAHIYGPNVTTADLCERDLADAPAILAASSTEYAFMLARAAMGTSTLSGIGIGLSMANSLLRLMP